MKIRILFSLLMLATTGWAQDVNYSITSNETPKAPTVSINTDLFNMEIMQKDLLAPISMNVAVWGHVEILPSFVGAQFSVRRSLFNVGRLEEKNFNPNLEMEIGGYLVISNRVVRKKTQVVLDIKKGSHNGNSITTTKSITIPADKRRQLHLRGGYYRKSTGNSLEHIDGFEEGNNNSNYVNYATSGFYTGFTVRTITSLFIKADGYGDVFHSLGTDFYMDLMVLPSNKWESMDGIDITDNVKSFGKEGPFGVRIGYKKFQAEPKSKTDKLFGMCGMFEVGYKPYTGAFVQVGLGMTIIKK